MNSPSELRNLFEQNELEKHQYIAGMYSANHRKLFEYSHYLKRTNIRSIEIQDDLLIMVTRDQGLRMACPAHDQRSAPIEILNFLDYEPQEYRMAEALFHDGGTFFDIGANLGFYSLALALRFRSSDFYCFEPIPSTFSQLNLNVGLNRLGRTIRTLNFGLSNKSGVFPFYFREQGTGNASAANLTGLDDVQVVQCTLRTLDDFTAENQTHVDFIKCDVEGAELFALQGGIQTIERDKPIIFAEILRKWSAKFDYDPNEIFMLMRDLGYLAFVVHANKLAPFDRMDDQTVQTNFFFLHRQKHENQIKRFSDK